MMNTNLFRKRGRILITGFLVVQVLFGYSSFAQVNVVKAQAIPDAIKSDPNASTGITVPEYKGVDQSIKDYLCVPDESNLGTALYDCIGKIYRFGIAFGAIALVFFIVFAGYLYMAGGETGKQKGKTVFTTAITGMAIILSSYVLLNFINPDLVKIKPIQPPIFTASSLPKCVDVGFGENCVLPNGQATGPSMGVAGSASEAQYKDLIAKYAQKNNMDYCMLSALIKKESSFIVNNVSNPPPGRVDLNNSAKYYGLTFTQGGPTKGHGIGLGQVFIYGPPPHRSWVNSDTPSRDGKEFGFDKPLTIKDLVDPEIGISAAAHFFGKLVNHPRNKDNLRLAYDDYQSGAGDSGPPGRPDSKPATLDVYMDMYTACKKLK